MSPSVPAPSSQVAQSLAWSIREARRSDDSALLELVAGLLSYEDKLASHASRPKQSARQRLNYLRAMLRSNGGGIWVAVDSGDQPVALLLGLLNQHELDPGRPANPATGMISDLFIREDLRRRGIARALIQEAEAFFTAQGCTAVTVANLVSNPAAAQAYQAAGYEPIIEWREKSLD